MIQGGLSRHLGCLCGVKASGSSVLGRSTEQMICDQHLEWIDLVPWPWHLCQFDLTVMRDHAEDLGVRLTVG